MPRTTEIWDEDAALAALCAMVREAIPALADAVYQGDLDPTMIRPSCRVYPVSEPIERAWTDQRLLQKQAQVWIVTVDAANEGELYRVTVLGENADYTAQVGDTVTDIRDALVLALAGLGLAITVADSGDAALQITGDTAGQHLAVAVTANMSAEVEVDNLHNYGLMPSWYTVRFEFEEQPHVDGSTPRAASWATRLRGWLQADISKSALHDVHLAFNQIVARGALRRPDRGKTTEVEWIDVQFSAVQGLGFDTPSLESFGTAPQVEVQ